MRALRTRAGVFVTRPRLYQGHAIDSRTLTRSISFAVSALIMAAAIAAGIFLATLLPYLSR